MILIIEVLEWLLSSCRHSRLITFINNIKKKMAQAQLIKAQDIILKSQHFFNPFLNLLFVFKLLHLSSVPKAMIIESF